MMGYKDDNVYSPPHEHRSFVVQDGERPLDIEQYKLHNQSIDLLGLQTDDSVSVP